MTPTNATAQTLPILLKALRLPHMQRQWQNLEVKAQQQGWSPGQFLLALCEYEHQQRYARRVQRYLKEAQLPAAKSLSNFDFTCCPSVNQGEVLNKAQDTAWLHRGENLLLVGPSGVGKTPERFRYRPFSN